MHGHECPQVHALRYIHVHMLKPDQDVDAAYILLVHIHMYTQPILNAYNP